jgi:cyclopropane fatty-acyl-phospholipid synthase-like methyltransferase
MSLAEFEARYSADPDPWGYKTSDYERRKYEATLAACGGGPFAHALELGGSIGVFSELLAPRCERLSTIDAAPTAVAAARVRLAGAPHVRVMLGAIPDALPDARFDLVVASEILYYLIAPELDRTLERLESCTMPGARLVEVHWRPGGSERPLDAERVHETLSELPWLEPLTSGGTGDYMLDVLERR